ncbi:MAG: Bro-N domain-containing protein [Candidatus Marinimicrobia bacterium]|nr:Bro-N domain-containing protein [Candidatus Neomarinimicrobiota bacterium]
METKLAIFQHKKIRKTYYKSEWWFSINDVIVALTDSRDPSQYFKRVKTRDAELKSLTDKGGVQFVPPLRLELKTQGGLQKTYCWNTEGIFRLIQSIPSPKAEPFKRWLAKVGYERIQEIENPELAQERMKQIYEKKGYPQDWIDKRIRGIAIRQNLTDEWKARGIEEQSDFAILTAEISKATFGMTPSEYRDYKNLPEKSKANLRDHMDDLELIFTMLGERVTTEISQQEKPDTFPENKKVAKRGGSVAGTARKESEKELGRPVSSKKNYLPENELKQIDENPN